MASELLLTQNHASAYVATRIFEPHGRTKAKLAYKQKHTDQKKHLYSKVEDHGFGRYFGRVVRVAELRSDVEFEVRVVVHLLVPDRNQCLVTTLDEGLGKYRLQNRIHLFEDILQAAQNQCSRRRCLFALHLRASLRNGCIL